MQHAPPLRAHRMVHVTGLISHAVNPVIWGPKDNASFVLPPMLLQKGNDVAKPGTSATILRERSSHATLPPGSEAMHTRSKTNMHGVPFQDLSQSNTTHPMAIDNLLKKPLEFRKQVLSRRPQQMPPGSFHDHSGAPQVAPYVQRYGTIK